MGNSARNAGQNEIEPEKNDDVRNDAISIVSFMPQLICCMSFLRENAKCSPLTIFDVMHINIGNKGYTRLTLIDGTEVVPLSDRDYWTKSHCDGKRA